MLGKQRLRGDGDGGGSGSGSGWDPLSSYSLPGTVGSIPCVLTRDPHTYPVRRGPRALFCRRRSWGTHPLTSRVDEGAEPAAEPRGLDWSPVSPAWNKQDALEGPEHLGLCLHCPLCLCGTVREGAVSAPSSLPWMPNLAYPGLS